MSILVTGGTGFIGKRLVDRLVKSGETVHVLDLAAGSIDQNHPRVRYFRGSITQWSDVERAMSGCDRVYHLAAYARNWAPDEETFFDVNVRGVNIVLAVAQKLKVKKVVHTSSNVALGPSNGDQVREASRRTTPFFTPYERSKFLSEQVVKSYVGRGMNIVIVNPSRVFGPGPLNESNSVTKMIEWYLEGKWRVVLGSGAMVGNYVFVDDLIDGYVRAMERGRSGERYILGGENVSFNDFFNTLADISGRRFLLFHLPARVALIFAHVEEFRSRHLGHYPLITAGWARTFLSNWANSCHKAQRELGYEITPLRVALEETVAWIRQSQTQASTA